MTERRDGEQGDAVRVTLRRGSDPERRVLQRVRQAILTYPEASRALYGALVAEGKRYADTEAGRVWADRLARSPKMRRMRLAWEVVSLSMLEGADTSDTLPSTWMDALYAIAGRSDMEEALAAVAADSGESE